MGFGIHHDVFFLKDIEIFIADYVAERAYMALAFKKSRAFNVKKKKRHANIIAESADFLNKKGTPVKLTVSQEIHVS